MPKLLKNIGRMFVSLRSILHKIFGTATKKTSSMFKTAALTIGTALAVLMTMVIILLVMIVSIPLGVFIKTQRKETNGEVIQINPAIRTYNEEA